MRCSHGNDVRLGADHRCGQLIGVGEVDGHCRAKRADTTNDPGADVLGLAVLMAAFPTIGSALLLLLGLGVQMTHSGRSD